MARLFSIVTSCKDIVYSNGMCQKLFWEIAVNAYHPKKWGQNSKVFYYYDQLCTISKKVPQYYLDGGGDRLFPFL